MISNLNKNGFAKLWKEFRKTASKILFYEILVLSYPSENLVSVQTLYREQAEIKLN
jgi:hypothetical protein